MKLFNVRETQVDKQGRKTTVSITTEDPKVIKGLLEKESASNKKNDSIKAKAKEVKKEKAPVKSPGAKKSNQKKTAVKKLPGPKASKSKASTTKKTAAAKTKTSSKSASKSSKKKTTLSIVGSNKKTIRVERLDNFYNKKTNSTWTIEDFDENFVYLVNYIKKDKWQVSHKYLADNFVKIAD